MRFGITIDSTLGQWLSTAMAVIGSAVGLGGVGVFWAIMSGVIIKMGI